MISRDGYAKILDFGLAKLLEPQQRTTTGGQEVSEAATTILSQYSTPGTILGTPGYVAGAGLRADGPDRPPFRHFFLRLHTF